LTFRAVSTTHVHYIGDVASVACVMLFVISREACTQTAVVQQPGAHRVVRIDNIKGEER